MSDRTTVNIDKRTHTAGAHIKEDFDDSWPEVIEFYVRYRPKVDELVSGGMDGSDCGDIDAADVAAELENMLDLASMLQDPSAIPETEDIKADMRKTQKIAEQARDNTEQIKNEIGR